MKHYIAEVRGTANDEFNHDVSDLFRRAGHVDVRENVKQLGTLKFQRANGEDIGDVDVLIIDRRLKVLLAVEVKDFEFARTPFELANELEKLLGDEDSAMSHHQERLAFLKEKLPSVLAALAIDDQPKDWQVHGLVVTSADLMGAQFPQARNAKHRLRIASFESLLNADPRLLVQRSRVNPSTRTDRRKRRKGNLR